jgi:homoserine dehydrogenase
VAKVLLAEAREPEWRAGADIAITRVSAREKNKDRGVDLSGVAFESDPLALPSGDVDVVSN